jgi:hypothetical protein
MTTGSKEVTTLDTRSKQVIDTLSSTLFAVLRPLVRILLRHGVSFRSFAETAKRVYVELGMEEFGIEGKKQTISRVAVLTGLTRKDVQRILHHGPVRHSAARERYNRAARVVAGWVRDGYFADEYGNPARLPIDGNPGFGLLVRRYSGDVPARAVLDELLRVGAVRRLADGRVELLSRAYVPRSSDLDKIAILGTDVADLIATIDHNLQEGEWNPSFQRKVMYDNLPEEAMAEFRHFSTEQAQQLMERLDRWLSLHDRDANPHVRGTGRKRAGMGVFYFEEDLAARLGEEST